MTARELTVSIEARYVALCRELVHAQGADPERLAYEALQVAVNEHAAPLRGHPEIALAYAVELEAMALEIG